jgi:hypothetical protein
MHMKWGSQTTSQRGIVVEAFRLEPLLKLLSDAEPKSSVELRLSVTEVAYNKRDAQ